MRMRKIIRELITYRYECSKCKRAFTELNDLGTLFCDCDESDAKGFVHEENAESKKEE